MTNFDYLPGTKHRQRPRQLEWGEQCALFYWMFLNRQKHPAFSMAFHIPNGGYRGKKEAARLKQSGVKAGVPDICIPWPTPLFHSLWIELKRPDGGKIEPSQMWWIDNLVSLGHRAEICRGWIFAAKVICNYLGIEATGL